MKNTTLCEFKYNHLIKSKFSQDGAKILFNYLNGATKSFMLKGEFDAIAICAYYKEITLDQIVQEALDFYDGEYYIEPTPECIQEEFELHGNKKIVGFTSNSVVYFDFACSCYLLDSPTVKS